MRKHEDFYVITDIKDDNYAGCKYIMDNYPDLTNRFIIQIYHIDEYEKINRLGFNNIIFTLYNAWADEKKPEALLEYTKEYDILGITFWEDWMKDENFFDILFPACEVPLFVHTVNDIDSIKSDLDTGVLVYTDNTENNWMRQETVE